MKPEVFLALRLLDSVAHFSWLDARQADLRPVEYYHVVFTLPAPISALAYTNKAVIYQLLFDVAAETLATIAADPKHLGAQIGITLVLHTWGSAMTHHPHMHGIVPGGGLSPDGERWIACRPGRRDLLARATHSGAAMKPHVSLSNRRCKIPLSALEILEPIADRFALPTVCRISSLRCNPVHARITAYGGKLKNISPRQLLIPTIASNSATIKSP